MSTPAQYAAETLSMGVRAVEQLVKAGKTVSYFGLQRAMDAAVLLGQPLLLQRLLNIANALPKIDPLKGGFSNLPAGSVPRWRPTLREFDDIVEHHPLLDEDYFERFMTGDHLGAVRAGEVARALALAKSEFDRLEVRLAQLVIAGPDAIPADLGILADRQHDIALVRCIEHARRGRWDAALEERGALIAGDFDLATLLAIGFAGRVPWIGYPFPDY